MSKPNPSAAHESAHLHVQGGAVYIDDIAAPADTLHVAPGLAQSSGPIIKLDLSAVRAAPGVVCVLTALDIPGDNNVAPLFHDEPLFADDHVDFAGQCLFAVVAQTHLQARRAAALAQVEIGPFAPLVSIEAALAAGSRLLPDYCFERGTPEQALKEAQHRLSGQQPIGGQEHFYLEGQISLALPQEDGDMIVHASTQGPSETQHVIAHVLGLPLHRIVIETRRMGGGFGGKETQANHTAALAALAAHVTRRAAKCRLDRDDDFASTGKRHDFRADWQVGYDDRGVISAYQIDLNARCGASVDLSIGVCDRSLFHAANCYYLSDVRLNSRRLKTGTVSNTAFRGFGGPQGMFSIERVMDAIAHERKIDPLDVRKANFYRPGKDITPYEMKVEEPQILFELVDQLEASSDYRARRKEIAAFNHRSGMLRKGLALTPVQFGISFTLVQLNQAGALVHVYTDGSVMLNHGGTEMGQGLFTKIAQVVAELFGLPLEQIRATATNTAKVPNTSPTAASSGTDLNGTAALLAAQEIRERMAEVAARHLAIDPAATVFCDGKVGQGERHIEFAALAALCWRERVHLSCAGFYKTPLLDWNRETKTGRPFYYFSYGAACAEVIVDIRTGEMKINRLDVLHDVGHSLNPALDRGQIEGALAQGIGWLTNEELVYDDKGRLLTHAPSTYKIPTASDMPQDLRVELAHFPNRQQTVYRSKAIGEPPLMLGISVFSATLDALQTIRPGAQVPLRAPATPEAIFQAAEALRAAAS